MTDFIINFINWITSLVMQVFPELSLASDILSNLNKYVNVFVDWIVKVNFIVPLPDIIAIMGFILSLKIASVAIWGVNWVIKRIFDVIP